MNTIHSKYHQDLILLPNNQLTAECDWMFWILVCTQPTPAHFDSTVSSKYWLECMWVFLFFFYARGEVAYLISVQLGWGLDEKCEWNNRHQSPVQQLPVQQQNFLSTRETAAVNAKMSANYQHTQCTVWDAFCYILSWYNPHFLGI